MRQSDLDVLKHIIDAGPHAEVKWQDDGKNPRVPRPELKRLAIEGYVEVETRRCSTWQYGPPYPYFYLRTGQTQADGEQQRRDYNEWRRTHPREWYDRSEVVAKATPMGIGFAAQMGLLD